MNKTYNPTHDPDFLDENPHELERQEMPDNEQEQTDAMERARDEARELAVEKVIRADYPSNEIYEAALENLFDAGYAAALEAGKAVDEKCGQGIQFGRFIMGCGRTLDTPRETYRCYDCDVAFHKNCLKQHCTERKHGEK
jgi:hypothetical protein